MKRHDDIHVSTLEELLNLPPDLITRRSMLSNVHRIFDPMGLLIPVLLQSKLLLRLTWAEKDLGWDDPLPEELRLQLVAFLKSLLSIEEASLPHRCYHCEINI